MDLFPLPLFPHGSLASSVITTVWIGVFVIAFFNLRFGWVFSGLVVPGYLVPLLMTKPWSAWVVVFEAIVTFLVVRFLSERPTRFSYWCSFFGRDRFFALLLFSVIIRLGFDGWLLPWAGEWVNTQFNIQIDYRNNLHSFGLIIIALIANQFWKTGVIRGLLPFVVTVGVTYLIIRYGLMELTNFTISKLNSMYEDLAASILASPKAYIILLVTAFLASRTNLKYGWDYNGILVPSLIALQWYQPAKVLTTFLEALLILLVAKMLLKTPVFTRFNMEGARKVLLFFNVGYFMKLLLGYTVPMVWPDIKVTDTFGFGYLLATLMAIRMYDQDVIARLTRATLQTSLTSLAVATGIGFVLASSFAPQSWSTFPATTENKAAVEVSSSRLIDTVRQDKVALYQSENSKLSPNPAPREVDRFRAALYAIAEHIAGGSATARLQAAESLQQIGYELSLLEDRYYYLKERPPIRGRGVFVIDAQARNALVVQAPAALNERGTAETATLLFQNLGARGLALAGARRAAQSDGSTDVLTHRNSLFQTFHKTLSRNHALQVRSLSAVRGRRPAAPPGSSELWVTAGLPADLDLPQLRRLIGELELKWAQPPFTNVQREANSAAFAELLLRRADMRRVAARAAVADHEVALQLSQPRIDGYLKEWLFGSKQRIADRGSDLYQPPRMEELLYLDEEVINPLLEVESTEFVDGEWTAAGVNEL
ncbi:MAG: poly-gamma-glutamate biosynthesis protein PgsC/CapC, partial [Gammaproteobacteria bacterium]|nr:poly-gamma-glutamate biosynthesis protein PgsC/CapC [Gammaproteobacteria bacterium]